MVLNASNTRIVALLSFVGALLYYQHTQIPSSTEAIVQIYEGGKLVNVSVSPEELENYLTLQQLQAKDNQRNELKAENRALNSSLSTQPVPPPSSPPDPPPVKIPEVNLQSKHAAYLPVLKPSNGSFLDTLDISEHAKEVL